MVLGELSLVYYCMMHPSLLLGEQPFRVEILVLLLYLRPRCLLCLAMSQLRPYRSFNHEGLVLASYLNSGSLPSSQVGSAWEVALVLFYDEYGAQDVLKSLVYRHPH